MRRRSKVLRSGAVGLVVAALLMGLGGCARDRCRSSAEDGADVAAPIEPSPWNLASAEVLALVGSVEQVATHEACGRVQLEVELRGVERIGRVPQPPEGVRFQLAGALAGALEPSSGGRLLVAASREEGVHGEEWWIRGIARVDDEGRIQVAGAPDAEAELAGFRAFIGAERPDVTDSLDLLASWSVEDQRQVPAGPDDPMPLDTLYQQFDGALRAVQYAASEPDAPRWERGVRWDLRGVPDRDVVVLSLGDDRDVLAQVRISGEGEMTSYLPLGRALEQGWTVRVGTGDEGVADRVIGRVPASVVTESGLLRLIVERADGSWSVRWQPATLEDDFLHEPTEQIELPADVEAGD